MRYVRSERSALKRWDFSITKQMQRKTRTEAIRTASTRPEAKRRRAVVRDRPALRALLVRPVPLEARPAPLAPPEPPEQPDQRAPMERRAPWLILSRVLPPHPARMEILLHLGPQ